MTIIISFAKPSNSDFPCLVKIKKAVTPKGLQLLIGILNRLFLNDQFTYHTTGKVSREGTEIIIFSGLIRNSKGY